MNSSKNYVILLLAATTIGGAVLAWQQYGELVELRAATLNKDERADLQKRIWELEKLTRELQDRLAARGEGQPDADNLIAVENGAQGERRERGPGRGGRGDPRAAAMQQFTAIRELMSKPEVQAMMSLQQKAGIEARYAALFKNLNLTPEQGDKLKALLAERNTTVQDVMTAAHEQGIDPRGNPEGFRKLIADAQNQVNATIKATIGEAGFAQLTSYEQTLPQRNLVNDLQQRLSYTNTPLTSAQAEQLVTILAANAPQRPATNTQPQPAPPPPGGRGSGGGPGDFLVHGPDIGALVVGAMGGGPGMGMPMGPPEPGGRGGGGAVVTSNAVSQAQGVLSAPQVAALQQIQQQQQTQQQLRQLVNETLSANQPPNARGAPGGPGGPGGGPPRSGGGGR